MTDKQEAFLSEYLHKGHVAETKIWDKVKLSLLIEMIIKLIDRQGNFITDVKEQVILSDQRELSITQSINSNRANYPGPSDEIYSYCHSLKVVGCENIYHIFKQSWYKGMSNSITVSYLWVDNKHETEMQKVTTACRIIVPHEWEYWKWNHPEEYKQLLKGTYK